MKQKVLISLIVISSLLFSYLQPTSASTQFKTLDNTVKATAKKYPHLSLYYENLVTGQSYSYQPTKVHSAASTIKLPLVLYIYELAANQKINLNQKLTYKSHHYYGGSGVIQHDKVGTQYTIKDLVKKSVVYSDNIAFIMLREKVGKANFIKYTKSIGGGNVYPGGKNTTTAKDLSAYLKQLNHFAQKNPKLGNELISLLKNTVYTDTVASSVDPNQVAHKVGYIPMNKIYNDAAIVFDHQPYILVIMTQGIPVRQDVKLISSLAEIVHQEHHANKIHQLMSLIKEADKSKVQLMKEISVDYEANVENRPYNTFNKIKKELEEVKSSYNYFKKQDQEKFSYLIKDIELWIERAIFYIDAISAGKRLDDARIELENHLDEGNLELAADKYHNLTSLVNRQAIYLYKPYGKSTREAILERYKNPAEEVIEENKILISVYHEVIRLEDYIENSDLESIERSKEQIESFIPQITNVKLRDLLSKKYEDLIMEE
ncbi:serine hydrolase [Cytobacillus sp. FJAT-54145]|uniref:Serine hydrolase n=1 Tax=Cytobacillus spartinae TaxID=3299023 RepID=A0ABW6KDE7_9BACI